MIKIPRNIKPISNTPRGTKKTAPKLKFQPGTFFIQNKQIYCIVWIFRKRESPNIWLYELKERTDTKEPRSATAQCCFAVSNLKPLAAASKERIIYEPITFLTLRPNDYLYGGRRIVTTSDLINNFKRID